MTRSTRVQSPVCRDKTRDSCQLLQSLFAARPLSHRPLSRQKRPAAFTRLLASGSGVLRKTSSKEVGSLRLALSKVGQQQVGRIGPERLHWGAFQHSCKP